VITDIIRHAPQSVTACLVMTVQALPKMAINDGVLELCKVLDKAQVPRYDGAHP